MTFSVVIPLYNGARHLRETLEAIAAQSLKPKEILVADDGSTDDGPEIARSFGHGVVWLPPGPEKGVQAARNRGIAAASSDWIALCDHDDLWLPNYLESHARLIEAAPMITLAFTNFRTIWYGEPDARTSFDRAPPGWWEKAGRRVLPAGWLCERPIASLTLDWQPIYPSGTVLTKALWRDVGGFDPAMRNIKSEDWEFTLRCLYRAKVGALPDPLFFYRRHESNSTGDLIKNLAGQVDVLKFVRETHEQARPFRAAIDAQIRMRRRSAMDAAFAAVNHPLFRRLFNDAPPGERSLRLWVKAACVALPDPLGERLNTMLQRARTGR